VGHNRLGRLPQTRKWRDVVSLIGDGAPVGAVAGSTLTAADSELARAMGVDRDASEGLADAPNDAGLVHAFWLLTQVALAARAANFEQALRAVGLEVPDSPTLFDVTSAFATTVHDATWREGRPSDIAEIARMAATETLTALCLQGTPSLFEDGAPNLQATLRGLSTPLGFSRIAEECFARLNRRYLLYLLSRELSAHVGPNRRFGDLRDRTAFNEALDTHCRQVSLIVRDFASGWYSKANYQGGITIRKARGFSHVALKKIRSEMSRR
jgi:hypothetical protein